MTLAACTANCSSKSWSLTLKASVRSESTLITPRVSPRARVKNHPSCAKNYIGNPPRQPRGKMTAAAQREAHLLHHKVSEADENTACHADKKISPAGSHAKRNGNQHDHQTRPRHRQPSI